MMSTFPYVMEKRQLLLILQRTTKYNFIEKENKGKDLNTTVPIRFVLLRHKIFRDV